MPIDNPSEPVTPGGVAVGRKVPAYPGRVLAPLPEALAARLRPDAVCSDPEILRSYALDGAPGLPATEDFTLVRARDRADVVAVLEEAQARRVPVVPQGARTGLAGAASARPGAIVLNLEALDTLVDINEVEGYAVVGPGVVTGELKRHVLEAGLFYPPDPASADSCTIGGNIATNAGGLCCLKYGVTVGYVQALELVLPGGEVMRTGHRTAKGVAGYDLTGLVVGSEGTLGVVTQAVLRLLPAPDPALTAVASFGSLDAAIGAVLRLRRDRHRPNLLELLDQPSLVAVQQLADYGLPVDAAAVLLVQSDRPGHAREDVYRYAEVLAEAGGVDIAVADTRTESELLLAGRRALNHAYDVKGARLAEDICVPVGALGRFIEAGQAISARTGVEITLAGHGGDGNLHPSLFYDRGEEASLRAARRAFDELVRAAWDLGGTVTGEHGVGTTKARHLATELGPAEIARQRALKRVFDPLGIMNPGVVFDDPASGAAYH